jgi:hypothetical protein
VLDNYEIDLGKASFTILPRPVAVTANAVSKTNGIEDPTMTYQITSGSLAFNDEFTGSLTREAGEEVGTYAILQGSLALDDNYALSYIGADFTINKMSTSISLTASVSSITYNESVVFTAQVVQLTPAAGQVRPPDYATGTVSFMDGETVIAKNVDLIDGKAEFTAEKLSGGSHEITAVYNGDAIHDLSTSDPVTLTVEKAGVTVAITSDLSQGSAVNKPYLVSVSVTSTAGMPTGTVTVSDGKDACTFDLENETSCPLTSTTAGEKTITATYSGDGNFEGGEDAADHQVWYQVILMLFTGQSEVD